MSIFTDRELLIVTGKGGVGRTTLSAAIGVAAAQSGRAAVICELSEQAVIPTLFGVLPPDPGHELLLGERLSSFTIDPEAALTEWIGSQAGGTLARTLRSSGSFSQLVAAAPGASELIAITKAWELGPDREWGRSTRHHDLVILDAPASGHGVAMLRAPRTYADIAGAGPIRNQAELVWELLADSERTAIIAATLPSELPIGETIELGGWVRETIGRELTAVIANRCETIGFSDDEMALLASAVSSGDVPAEALDLARSAVERQADESDLLRRLERDTGLRPIAIAERSAGLGGLELVEAIAADLTDLIA